jgi:hypothetical protein
MPLVAIICTVVFVPWILVKAWILPLPESVQEQLNDAIDYGFDGIIVYVDPAGNEPEYYAAGWHDRAKRISAYPDAYFKIASIGKLYDVVVIAKMVSEGRLSLDGTLTEYIPDLMGRVEYADRITLKMLVQHRSGIPNITDTPNFWTNPPENSQEALNRILDLPANFEPDQDYEYSNTNYLLISQIIEKVSGMSKYEVIKSEILMPLGLQHTFGSMDDVESDSLMSGYYVGVEEDIKSVDYGSMVATAEDVGIFLRALNDGTIFDEGEQEIYSSLYVYDHTGLIPGYQSIAKYHQDIDTVLIQFVNTTNFDGHTWTISEIVYNRIVKILRRTDQF